MNVFVHPNETVPPRGPQYLDRSLTPLQLLARGLAGGGGGGGGKAM